MTTITCPQCHHQNPDDTEFCEQCGAQLPVAVAVGASGSGSVAQSSLPTAVTTGGAGAQLICPTCQAPLAPGDEFCFNCGTDVRNLTSQAGPAANQNGVAPAAQPDPNAMSDDALNRALSGIDNGAPSGQSQPPLTNQVGPEAQPAVVPPQTPVAPQVGNTSDGSLPAQPGVQGGVAANAFGPPPTPATPSVQAKTGPLNPPPAATSSGATTGTLHLHISGPYGDEVIDWKGHEILLGRNDPKTRVFPEVNLDDSAASRRHLSIWKEDADSQYYAQDLESANGTSLNGQDLRPGEATNLHDGDTLKIGTRYNIQVKIN